VSKIVAFIVKYIDTIIVGMFCHKHRIGYIGWLDPSHIEN
jgi:hypothetical protein